MIVAVAATALGAPQARAAIRLGLLGGFNSTLLTGFHRDATPNAGLSGQIGGTLALRLGPLSVEGGVFYGGRDYGFTKRQGEIREADDYAGTVIEYPIMARLWLSDVFSIGAGGYYAVYAGDASHRRLVKNFDKHKTIEHDERIYIDRDQGISYGGLNRKKHEYGALGGVQFAVPLKHVAYLIEARYLLGLSDNTVDSARNGSSKTRSFQFLIGIGYEL